MSDLIKSLPVLALLAATAISPLLAADAPAPATPADAEKSEEQAMADYIKALEERRAKPFNDDSYALPRPPTRDDAERFAKEARESLTLNGVPLSPVILAEFRPPELGLAPLALELNLLDLARNRYNGEFSALPAAEPGKPRDTVVMHNDGKVLRYRKLGRIKSGAWVVHQECFEADSGRLTCSVLLLRVSSGTVPATRSEEKRLVISGSTPAVLLRCVGFLKLAERERRRVSLDGDALLLTDPEAPTSDQPLRVDLSGTP